MIEVKGDVVEELRTLFYKTWRRVWFRNLPHELVPMRMPRDLVPLSKRPTGRVYVLASGLDIVGGTPAQLRQVLDQDIATWTKVVKLANIKVN